MNLGQLRTALQQRGYATDTATAQSEMLNAVYRRICGLRRWPFLEATNSSITTTSGTETYSLTGITDLAHIDAVRLQLGTQYIDLENLRFAEYRHIAFIDRDPGVPREWARSGDTLYLWPIPNAAYTVVIDYIKDPPDLANDSDTPVIPAGYHDVLVWGAIAEMCFRERDLGGLQEAQNRFNWLLRDMMNEYGLRQRQTSDEVIHSGYWDAFDASVDGWLSY